MEPAGLVALAAVVAAAAVALWAQEQRVRQAKEERGRAWAHEDRMRERIEELERQVDELHGQGLMVPPANGRGSPDELPEGVELPEVVDTWIEAGDFPPEVEQEYRMYAAHQLQDDPSLQQDPDELIAAMRE